MDALANWLWQGCAVTLAATVILRVSRGMSATTRYRLWWMTLLLVLLLPVAPALSVPHETAVLSESSADGMLRSVPLPPPPSWFGVLVVMLWAAWVTVCLWRTAGSLVTLRRVKRSCRSFPPEREARLPSWMVLRDEGRRARLVVSDEIRSAAVLGLTSPAIAVAPTVLQELNDQELDQILVHEWAHVQRRDDLARLLQLLVRALAGLHPAVLWIDRRLQVEREAACDDWAVNVTGSAKGYAACLAKLAALPARSLDAVLLPAALSSSDLTTRIFRLLDRHRNTSTRRALAAMALTAPVLIGLALIVASLELVVMAMPMESVASSSVAVTKLRLKPTSDTEASVREASLLGARPPGAAAPKPGLRGDVDTFVHIRAMQARLVQAVSSQRAAVAKTALTHSAVRRGPRERQRSAGTQAPVLSRTDIPAFMPDPSGKRADTPTAAEDVDRERGPWTKTTTKTKTESELPPGAAERPGTLTTLPGHVVPAALRPDDIAVGAVKSETPWGAAAGAGVRVGRGSQKAAVATAGFFTRLGKSIADVF